MAKDSLAMQASAADLRFPSNPWNVKRAHKNVARVRHTIERTEYYIRHATSVPVILHIHTHTHTPEHTVFAVEWYIFNPLGCRQRQDGDDDVAHIVTCTSIYNFPNRGLRRLVL